jgi:CHAT domain-containing protein/tetratricopeptide (TPR) repeat protein
MRSILNTGEVGVLLLAVLLARPCPAEGPAGKLNREQETHLRLLQEQINSAFWEGSFERAAEAAREVASSRERWQGKGHCQTVDAQWQVQRYETLARVPEKDRKEVASSFRAQAEGAAQAARHKYKEAEAFYRTALNIDRRTLGEEHRETATCYNNLASNLDDQGRHAESRPLYEKALAIRRKVLGEEHPDTATSYNSLAGNLWRQGKYAEAQPLYEKALAICRKVLGEEHPDTALGYNNLGINLKTQGKYTEAQPLLEKALAIRRKVLGEEHPDTAACYNNLADILWRQGQVSAAVDLLGNSLPGQETARFFAASSGFDRAIAAGAKLSPRQMLAVGLARLGQPAEAFVHAEASLARGLLDDLAHSSNDDIRPLRNQAAGLDQQLLALYGKGQLSPEQEKLRQQLLQQRREVSAELARRAAALSARQVLPLADIQKQLPADTALLLWIDIDSLGEHHACLVRSAGEPVWVRLPGSRMDGNWCEADKSLDERLYQTLSKPDPRDDTDCQRLTAALVKLRFEPLRPHLNVSGQLPAVRQLLVVPTGWVARVPLEVLDTGYRISYVSSGSVYARLRQHHRTLDGSSLLALGAPVYKNYAPLPGTRGEVQSLAGLVPGSTTLLGSDACEQRLDELSRTGQLKGFRLLHLAAHGRIHPERPEWSALLLANDHLPDPLEQQRQGKPVYTGELRVGVIRKWQLDADLVTLSACQTALGTEGSGDGLLGFAQAFFQSGSRAVLLSRWSVADRATALLMQRFYQNLLGKREGLSGPMSRGEALAEARQWLRQLSRGEVAALETRLGLGQSAHVLRSTEEDWTATGNGEKVAVSRDDCPYAHPAYWAAFVLVGDPD